MRIGIFTETYLPDVNGVVTSVVSLKKALEMHGHEVYIVTNHESLIKTTYTDDEKILRLPGIKLDFLYGYKVSSPIQLQATRPIKKWDLDIIHIQQEFGVGIYGRYLASSWEIPLINTYHTTYEDYTHYLNVFNFDLVDSITKKVIEKLSKSFTKKSNIVVAPSQKTKEMLLGYGIEKQIEVIPTGLDLERFDSHKTSNEVIEQIKGKYNINPEDTLFTYVGRLAQEKSVDEVVEAFRIIKDREINAKLLIVGDGPDLNMLKKLANKLDIEDYVFFEGLIPSDDVPSFYHAADAFISASTSETQGLTYIEALASGLSIFVKPDEVLQELVVENETGFYFTNPEDLADRIEYFTKADNLKAKMRDKALEMSRNYSLEVYYERMIKCYEEAIAIEEQEKNYFD